MPSDPKLPREVIARAIRASRTRPDLYAGRGGGAPRGPKRDVPCDRCGGSPGVGVYLLCAKCSRKAYKLMRRLRGGAS